MEIPVERAELNRYLEMAVYVPGDEAASHVNGDGYSMTMRRAIEQVPDGPTCFHIGFGRARSYLAPGRAGPCAAIDAVATAGSYETVTLGGSIEPPNEF